MTLSEYTEYLKEFTQHVLENSKQLHAFMDSKQDWSVAEKLAVLGNIFTDYIASYRLNPSLVLATLEVDIQAKLEVLDSKEPATQPEQTEINKDLN